MHTKAPVTTRYSVDNEHRLLRDGVPIGSMVRPLLGPDMMTVAISLAERDALMQRIANLLNAEQHAESPQQWGPGDGSTALEKQAANWREVEKYILNGMIFGQGCLEVRAVDVPDWAAVNRHPTQRPDEHSVDTFKINALKAALAEAIESAIQGPLDPGVLPRWQAVLKMVEHHKVSRDTLEAMCARFHHVRSQQGFTTASWGLLEERNRQQYRDALAAALGVLGVTCD